MGQRANNWSTTRRARALGPACEDAYIKRREELKRAFKGRTDLGNIAHAAAAQAEKEIIEPWATRVAGDGGSGAMRSAMKKAGEEMPVTLPPEFDEKAWQAESETVEDTDASTRKVVEWVAKNIMNPKPKRSEAPSAAAWGMLFWAKTSKHEFYTTVYPKLSPTLKELGEEAKIADDGRNLDKALLRMSEEHEKAKSQNGKKSKCEHCGA